MFYERHKPQTDHNFFHGLEKRQNTCFIKLRGLDNTKDNIFESTKRPHDNGKIADALHKLYYDRKAKLRKMKTLIFFCNY